MVLDLSGRNIYQLPVSFLKCQGWLNPFNTLARLAIIHNVHAPAYEPSVMVDGGSWRHGLFSPKWTLKISNFSCWWVAHLVELHHGGAGKWGYWDLNTYVGLFLTLDMIIRLENMVQNFASGYVDHVPFWCCMPIVKNAYPCFSPLNGIVFCWVISKCNNIDATI